MSEQTAVAFFDQLMAQSDDEARNAEISLARRSLQREVQAVHDHYEGKILGIEKRIAAMYKALKDNPSGGLNVEQLVNYQVDLEAATAFKTAVASTYQELFGETL